MRHLHETVLGEDMTPMAVWTYLVDDLPDRTALPGPLSRFQFEVRLEHPLREMEEDLFGRGPLSIPCRHHLRSGQLKRLPGEFHFLKGEAKLHVHGRIGDAPGVLSGASAALLDGVLYFGPQGTSA